MLLLILEGASVVSVLAVFAAFARAPVSASDPALIALAVLLETPWLLAVTSFRVEASVWMYLWLKGIGIPLLDCIHCLLALIVIVFIRAIAAVAIRAATDPKSKAVTVELQTLWLLAVARWTTWSRFLCWLMSSTLALFIYRVRRVELHVYIWRQTIALSVTVVWVEVNIRSW